MTLKVTRAEFLGIDRMDEDELRDNVLELLAENAKLRDDLEEANNQAEEACIENAKLRELGGCMAKVLRIGSGWCNRDCADEFDCDFHECPIEAYMRELGIEVDE